MFHQDILVPNRKVTLVTFNLKIVGNQMIH